MSLHHTEGAAGGASVPIGLREGLREAHLLGPMLRTGAAHATADPAWARAEARLAQAYARGPVRLNGAVAEGAALVPLSRLPARPGHALCLVVTVHDRAALVGQAALELGGARPQAGPHTFDGWAPLHRPDGAAVAFDAATGRQARPPAPAPAAPGRRRRAR